MQKAQNEDVSVSAIRFAATWLQRGCNSATWLEQQDIS
jgi:hypothetical protein